MEQKAAYKIAGRDKTIFRTVHDQNNPYVTINSTPITNPGLSFKAKGILTYLLSRPDGWEVNVPDLVNHSTDGPAAVRSGLKELRAAGHIHYNTQREGGYIKRWVIEVYEIPFTPDVNDEAEKVLDSDFQQVGNQQVGNRGEVLKNLSINDSNNSTTTTTTGETAKVFKAYTDEIGPLTPTISEKIGGFLDDPKCPNDYITDAIAEAARQNKRNWAYCEAILRRWMTEGKQVKVILPNGPRTLNYANSRQPNNSRRGATPPAPPPSEADIQSAMEMLKRQRAGAD